LNSARLLFANVIAVITLMYLCHGKRLPKGLQVYLVAVLYLEQI